MIQKNNINDNNNDDRIKKSNINEFQSLSKEIIKEDVKENLTQINNSKEFKKYKFRRQNTINFRKKNSKAFK